MAYDKVVDSAKLDAGMTATANAIRAKTGGSSAIPWKETTGFADAVGDISQAEDLSAELAAQDALISALEEAVAGKAAGGGTAEPPNIQPLNVTENGTYAASGDVDGYSPIVVNVPKKEPVLKPLNVTVNGTYTPSGADGFSEVTVNVPTSGGGSGDIELCTLEIRNGTDPGIMTVAFTTVENGVMTPKNVKTEEGTTTVECLKNSLVAVLLYDLKIVYMGTNVEHVGGHTWSDVELLQLNGDGYIEWRDDYI